MRRNNGFSVIENGTLAITTLAFGIMAGFFWTYSFNVNLAMLKVDGATYAEMQSLFNQNVRHLMFFAFFFGAGVISFIAVLANLKKRRTFTFFLLFIASLIYILGVIVFTAQINLPLNAYTESWISSTSGLQLPADWEATRNSWNHANMIRVGTSCTAFFLTVFALMIRATGSSRY